MLPLLLDALNSPTVSSDYPLSLTPLMAFLMGISFLLLVFLVNQAFDELLLVSGPGKGPYYLLNRERESNRGRMLDWGQIIISKKRSALLS